MATAYDRIAFLNEYLQHSDRYLPMIDHAWQIFPQRSEYGEVNIGWDAGLIAEKRPYFCECWAEGYTVLRFTPWIMITVLVSSRNWNTTCTQRAHLRWHAVGINKN